MTQSPLTTTFTFGSGRSVPFGNPATFGTTHAPLPRPPIDEREWIEVQRKWLDAQEAYLDARKVWALARAAYMRDKEAYDSSKRAYDQTNQ